jgi:hypothetical protein
VCAHTSRKHVYRVLASVRMLVKGMCIEALACVNYFDVCTCIEALVCVYSSEACMCIVIQ